MTPISSNAQTETVCDASRVFSPQKYLSKLCHHHHRHSVCVCVVCVCAYRCVCVYLCICRCVFVCVTLDKLDDVVENFKDSKEDGDS